MAAFEVAFQLVGLPRSGQHGVATWLMGNLPSPSLFVNNCTSIRPDPIWYIGGKRMGGYSPDGDGKFICYGVEGEARLADDRAVPAVFVVRDIKNHMASLIAHRTLQPKWDEFFHHWKQYAVLGTEIIPKRYRYLVVPFSSWHSSKLLRRDLYSLFEDLVGLKSTNYNDDTRKDVMASGGGSSFDGQKFLGCGDRMGVLERYKRVKLPPIPQEVLELNEALFGAIYDD